MGNCFGKTDKNAKKLKFSPGELKKLASKTKFNLPEVKLLYKEFLKHAGKRKPLQGGLSKVQFLSLFGMSSVVGYAFAERFAERFAVKRSAESKTEEVGFEDFVLTFSTWTRGEPEERLDLLFKMYDREGKEYICREDIVEFLESIFRAFVHTDLFQYSRESPEKKAMIEIQSVTDEVLKRESAQYFQMVADNAIRSFESDEGGAKLLFPAFKRWILEQPGVVNMLCVPTDVHAWMERVQEKTPAEDKEAKKLHQEIYDCYKDISSKPPRQSVSGPRLSHGNIAAVPPGGSSQRERAERNPTASMMMGAPSGERRDSLTESQQGHQQGATFYLQEQFRAKQDTAQVSGQGPVHVQGPPSDQQRHTQLGGVGGTVQVVQVQQQQPQLQQAPVMVQGPDGKFLPQAGAAAAGGGMPPVGIQQPPVYLAAH
uniref:EF-hand domain-containing protein n=1 Tax=Chromera velia CCMP2878 TaxID=1169474 RepID=A0A0G4GMT3_9ALVE|mmetsp:Transcript_36904/g.72575  ORF Transcript_36904/g.72575 Transcript_36904/m.72575 type:complete len:428 (+) Transcript_36904:212-1495(+)|eukprot:Cvel_22601.t1-p1 / transcript=Cvel_22601.t1 / gene=Cvel_22601 / organism=Chromera_velia_CCMP2878 / gene_product=Recoverin family protein DDB_G0274781, putative / transcript_product=Recoverin family protein DDB_G0274781, putative / location=Cvel_scaffold2237:12375-16540(+) / protein_length=427 / sequence_SO=supercontig / SO=protein_coding / is_pseudo=false